MFDYKIDTKVLPTVYITWASTKGGAFNKRYWLNCKTGKKKDTPEKWMYYPDERAINYWGWQTENHVGIGYRTEKNPEVWVKSGSTVKYAYVKYHKKIDMLEIAAVGVETTRKEEPHEWKYLGDRFFIDRNKTIYDQTGRTPSRYHLYDYHNAYNPNELLGMLSRLSQSKWAMEEFKKFIGNDFFTIGSGRCVQITHLWHIQEWYKTVQKARSKGKEQMLTDMLTEITLSDVSDFNAKYPETDSHDRGYCITLKGISYFERVNDDWSVVRIFNRNENALNETYRLYINNNGKLRYVSYGQTGWIPANPTRGRYSQYNKFVNLDEAVEKCPRIKYAAECIKDMDQENLIDYLITSLRLPEIEQLAKLGCTKIVKSVLRDSYPKANLKSWFGDYYNEKEKNILRKIGMSKSQLDYYNVKLSSEDRYYSNYRAALKEMRSVFGDDLSHLDNESYKKYLDGMVLIKRHFWRGIEDYANELHFDADRFTKNLIRLGEKHQQVYQLANDTLELARSLTQDDLRQINWYFDDYSDVTRLHDAFDELKRRRDAERRALWDMQAAERQKKEEEKRIKVDKERKKYEYEDDNYIIRLPLNASEIVSEGSLQRICIGGYTTRHALGETNLFFLREKSNPDKPFYAIEMNHDSIVQIHGFGNKWLGNNPEAIPTVIRWLRKHEISCKDDILTCTSSGYGRVNNYVPMPVVD